MHEFTFITTYYSQAAMLRRHIEEWAQYPPEISIILVDDGSPIPALPVVAKYLPLYMLGQVRLYRILENIPWSRSSARNLAMQEALMPWCVVTDIDHILPVACATRLLTFAPSADFWYRFPRWRRGQADDTRNKDAIPRTAVHGKIHPHIDSYLIQRGLYWDAGGYNPWFNGAIGGGSEFLSRLGRQAPVALLPDDIFLDVYTKHVIPDASVTGLSRETAEYSRRRKQLEARGNPKPTEAVTLPWERVL